MQYWVPAFSICTSVSYFVIPFDKIVNTRQLKWVARKLPKRNNKWFAALEQSGLSATNFLYSLVIIKFASIGELGVYTFWFVICQFMAMLTMGLATRQMVLEHANKPLIVQYTGLKTTCIIVLALQLVQVSLLFVLVRSHPPDSDTFIFWVALATYCVSFNLAELYRQFYYMSARQRLSLYFSTISLASGVFGFLVFAASGVSSAPELSAFWFLASGNLIYVAFAFNALKKRNLSGDPGSVSARQLFLKYRKHGVPATGGMLVTWMQNQSVTPLLMFMFGPLVVGYYSVAKMIITPINMVTTGLGKSSLSQIRKAYEAGGHKALVLAVRAHRRTSMQVVLYYVTLVGIGGVVAQIFGVLDLSDTLIVMILATVLVSSLSNFRYWVGQIFVVKMQYGTLLRIAIVASCATVTMMLISGLVFNSALWVVFGPALGEIILIFTLMYKLGRPSQNS